MTCGRNEAEFSGQVPIADASTVPKDKSSASRVWSQSAVIPLPMYQLDS